MAIFHSYCDESGKKGDSPIATFSALCLPHSKLALFDTDWEKLLRQVGKTHLHMVKATRLSQNYGDTMPRHQTAKERMECLAPFAECVNQYFEVGVMMAIEIEAFNSLSEKARRSLGSPDDPYYVSFMRGSVHLVRYLQEDDRLSLICDDDLETALSCYGFYRAVRRTLARSSEKNDLSCVCRR